MSKNIFRGLNQSTAAVMAEVLATGATPANLFLVIASTKNPVQEYLKSNLDIVKFQEDLKVLHKEQLTKDTKGFEKVLRELVSELRFETQDRYIKEPTLINAILTRGVSNVAKTTFKNAVGKYLDPTYVQEDIQKLVNTVPNLEWENTEATILDILGRNLTQLAKDGDLNKIVGREDEIKRMQQILTRQSKANPALVGPAGVGKTALAEKLALVLLSKAGVPQALHGYEVREISIPEIISTGDIEGTIQEMVRVASSSKVILFMDEVHMIMNDKAKIANLLKPAMARGDIKIIGATTEDEYKVFEKDKAMVRRWQPVQVKAPDKVETYRILKARAREIEEHHDVLIPDATLLKSISLSERYVQHRQQPDKSIDLIEEAGAKLRMTLESKPLPLQKVQTKLADIKIEMQMLQANSTDMSAIDQERLEAFKDEAAVLGKEQEELEATYKEQLSLLHDMIQAKHLLEEAKLDAKKAIHHAEFEKAADIQATLLPVLEKNVALAEQAILDFATTADEACIQNTVTPNMVARVIEEATGIPATSQDQDTIEKYRDMEAVLKEKVHGQDRPIDTIAKSIKRAKAGLNDGSKPLGSFLEFGPTGVGKTYLAQSIAEFMFDTDKVLHRFDMSEYMEAHSVARLFGSPPGYVGHDQGGQLTEAIKRNPYSIILFDEVEKAHPRVFDALLQILDAGRMTDGQGQEVNFKNTIIIMTSNIGSQIIRNGVEQGYPQEAIEEAINEEAYKHFRPEFLNRFDAKVVFRSLTPQATLKIAESELRILADRIQNDNEIEIHWSKDLPTAITNEAYDLMNGARPIKRWINDVVVDALTEAILNQEIRKKSIVYIAPTETGVTVFEVTRDELSEIQSSEVQEITFDDKIRGGFVVPESDIVDADITDIGEPEDRTKSSKKGKKKKGKKKSLKDALASDQDTFTLKTETGD